MSAHHNRSSGAGDRLTPLLSLLSLGALLIVIVMWFIWPDEVTPALREPATPPAPAKPLTPTSLSEEPSIEEVSEPMPLEKQQSLAREGLGASLAQAPLPKPSARRELPKDLNLGEHLITLQGGEWRLRLTLTLSSDEPDFSRFAGPLRRRFIEMTFFLVSHRVPEGVRGPSGEERLRRDLLERFQNVLRDREFELYIDGYAVEEVEASFDEE